MVTAKVYKNGSLKLEGDLSKVKGGNALRLLQFVKSDKSMTSAHIRRKDLVACDHPTSEMGLLRLANAQVRSLRADNPAADTCLRTNSSSSLRWEYGASTQFHLGDEQVALGEPVHIARKYFLRRHAPVGLPSTVAEQVACEHFMTQGLENI